MRKFVSLYQTLLIDCPIQELYETERGFTDRGIQKPSILNLRKKSLKFFTFTGSVLTPF